MSLKWWVDDLKLTGCGFIHEFYEGKSNQSYSSLNFGMVPQCRFRIYETTSKAPLVHRDFVSAAFSGIAESLLPNQASIGEYQRLVHPDLA